jgi:hypothetical protein
MNTQEILTLFDKQQRIEIEYPGMTKEIQPHVVRFLRPPPGMSFVLHTTLDESNADAVIQEQIDYFKQIEHPFDWKVYDYDAPSDLRERMVAHGFEQEDPDAVMVLDLHEAPPILLAPPTIDVRRLSERDQLSDVIQIEAKVWNDNFDWIKKRLGDHMEIPGYLSVFVSYLDGNPGCAGWIYYHPNSQFASLWGGSTVSEFRKQGLYTAVLAARVQESIQRGYRFLVIDASPMSRPIVAKHGFELLTYAHVFKLKEAPRTEKSN